MIPCRLDRFQKYFRVVCPFFHCQIIGTAIVFLNIFHIQIDRISQRVVLQQPDHKIGLLQSFLLIERLGKKVYPHRNVIGNSTFHILTEKFIFQNTTLAVTADARADDRVINAVIFNRFPVYLALIF